MSVVPFLILKIGGVLFSDKSRQDHIDLETVRKFARIVARLAHRAPGRMALIIGGGAIGHSVARRIDRADRLGALPLTEATFGQKWIWNQALLAEGALSIPLQLTGICIEEAGGLSVCSGALQRLLSLGLLPLLSGDCIAGSDGVLRVFGSDRVPEVLLRTVSLPVRIVALTNTSGIVRERSGSQTLRHVHPDSPEEAYGSVWKVSEYDTTGGMEGKLNAFLGFARKGAECFVIKGDADAPTLDFLLDPPMGWPSEIVYTRISES